MKRVLPALLAFVLLASAACRSPGPRTGALPTAPSPAPTPASSANTAAAIPPPPAVVEDPPAHDERPADIWLIPVVGFPEALTVDLIARLEADTGLRIRSSVDAGISPSLFFPDSRQMNADRALREFSRVPASLGPAKPRTTYLFLTAYDINSEDRRFRFLFARSDVAHRRALISIARMTSNPDGVGEAPILTKLRLYKMAKRQIGEMYHGYSRSSDPNSIMYSPLMGLDDLDMLGTDF